MHLSGKYIPLGAPVLPSASLDKKPAGRLLQQDALAVLRTEPILRADPARHRQTGDGGLDQNQGIVCLGVARVFTQDLIQAWNMPQANQAIACH
jgi:hypothetical protein